MRVKESLFVFMVLKNSFLKNIKKIVLFFLFFVLQDLY
jgi:hypothetical protein